jgi:hypothetical protein
VTRYSLPVMRPDAAGVDIGATEIVVAVLARSAGEHVGSFRRSQGFVCIGRWLKQCGIKTGGDGVEGVYWIPLFQISGNNAALRCAW